MLDLGYLVLIAPSFISKCSKGYFKNLEMKRRAVNSKLLAKTILFLDSYML